MRILQRVGIMNRGGQETLWMNFLRNCQDEDMHIDFLVKTEEKGAYDDEITKLGSKIIFQGNCKYKSIFKYIERSRLVANIIKENGGYDVLHINTYVAIDALSDVFAGKKAGINTIVVHSHNSKGPHRIAQFVLRIVLNNLGIKKVACSDKAAKWMFGSEKGIYIINNGIDTNIYQMNYKIRCTIREQYGVNKEDVLIGHVGRFDEQKNHSFLIDIFKEIHNKNSNVKLILVGKGPLEDTIKRKVSEAGLNNSVIFFGSSNKVNELMMAMDIFMFPSLYEGLPLVMIEAQASGLKCICSDSISSDVIITDDVIQVSLSYDAKIWATKVIDNLHYNRTSKFEKVAQKGFDIKETIKQVKELYGSK